MQQLKGPINLGKGQNQEMPEEMKSKVAQTLGFREPTKEEQKWFASKHKKRGEN